MKTLVKWAIKKFVSKERIKDAIHAANAKLKEKETTARTAEIMGYGEDASEVIAAYLNAYANDGKMDDAEAAAVDAACDAVVDKYLDDDRLDRIVDALFD
jgi:hypothetical protein